jgi:hypothetical protein
MAGKRISDLPRASSVALDALLPLAQAGQTVAATVSQVVSQYTARFNVLDYGAVGDGVTDDTEAVQDAIDATPAGGSLYLPQGYEFYCASNLTRDGSAIRIFGSGASSKITFGESAGLIVNGTSGTDSFYLEDCSIGSGGTSNVLVTLARINSQGSIRNVYFQGGGTHLLYERSVYNVLVEGCTFYAASVLALSLIPATLSTLNANSFQNCFFVGNKRHVEMSNSLIAVSFNQCVFQRNSSYPGAQSGVFIHGGCWNTLFDGCGFEEVNAVPCIELGRCMYPTIRAGYFSMNSADATAVDCTGNDGDALGLTMDGFSLSANNADNTLIDLRSYGARANLSGLIYIAGTCAKAIGGTVPERDVRIDILYSGTFTIKSDYKRRAGDLTAWWMGSGASTPVAAASYNLTVSRIDTGVYVATFATPMENAAYVPVVSSRYADDISDIRVQPSQTVDGFTFVVVDSLAEPVNANEIQIHVAGGLD